MKTAKDVILDRVRAAIGNTPSAETAERHYRQSAPADLALFEDRLIEYGVSVYRCSQSDVPQTIRTALVAAGKQRVLIPAALPDHILPDDLTFERDNGQSYEELDRVEGVVTGCALAVAETGTIFLRHTQADGRRALTLIPDYHLCIVYAEQVVGTVPEGIRRAATFGRAPITTVSGPSATSDIEMTRVSGVHGPRTLQVILVT